MKIIICPLLLFLTLLCFSQDYPSSFDIKTNLDNIFNPAYGGILREYDNAYEGVKGYPFLFEEWHNGTITLNDNSIVENIELIYDIYKNNLYYKKSDKNNSFIINLNVVNKFTIETNTKGEYQNYIKTYLQHRKKSNPLFLEVLYEN